MPNRAFPPLYADALVLPVVSVHIPIEQVLPPRASDVPILAEDGLVQQYVLTLTLFNR